jgi:hypothetical protein
MVLMLTIAQRLSVSGAVPSRRHNDSPCVQYRHLLDPNRWVHPTTHCWLPTLLRVERRPALMAETLAALQAAVADACGGELIPRGALRLIARQLLVREVKSPPILSRFGQHGAGRGDY